ncbi:4300_t:CDS:2 [Funneliformis caledonium]|uniref:Carbonic anhydrase n=2 Tax=Funneliformis TaxID=1117308 RepID=A0A9N9DKC5_9GLOM|nr:4300_t:CDS:2 [Funneliformis caledonium]CAG8669369.1 14546_t:CDS:2 [Funneliformis mosseae]
MVWPKGMPILKNFGNSLKIQIKDMPILQRSKPKPNVVVIPNYHLPIHDDPNIIKAHVPDLIRSYEQLPNGLKDIFENNRKWANTEQLHRIKFFENLSKGQSCSDSRVVPETITQLGFGQIFVHRNVANQFNANDLNCMSELEFAVHNIKVEHIIVCGHTNCAGVMNACNDELHINLKTWLTDIRKIKDEYPELFPNHVLKSTLPQSEIDRLHKRLIKINVSKQVNKIASNEIVQEAWKDEKRKLAIHGWVFNVENGHLEDIGVTVGKH